MLPVCCSYVLVCDSYVTRMLPVCTRILLVCSCMLLICTRAVFELIIWKVNPFQMIGEFLTATFLYTMRWKIFQWMKFPFRHSSSARKLSRQKFHNKLACVFTVHCASNNVEWNQQQLTDGGILGNRNSANHPYCFLFNKKEVHILAFFARELVTPELVNYLLADNWLICRLRWFPKLAAGSQPIRRQIMSTMYDNRNKGRGS